MLQDIEARKAKPAEKPYKLTDERGLYLLVNPNGGKLWRMNYRHWGKQKTLSFGILDTAQRIRSDAGRVFRSAVATGRAERGPTSELIWLSA